MKIIFTLFTLLYLPAVIFSQTKISGSVTDKSSSPLPGANIFLKDTYDGISSDAEGKFFFTTEEKGEVILVVSFVGFKPYQKNIILAGEEINIQIVLEEESTELGTVVISAGSFEASDENKAVILRPLDIVTTGSDADIYSALETLPGTQQIGETEGLFVRGGSAAEAKTYIDEMLVQNPFYSNVPDIPARGRFSAFLFKGTIFSTGGYSAQYGQALSSALILKTQDLAAETGTAINLMPLGFGGAHTQRWENSSLSSEIFYSNLGPYFEIQNQRIDWDIAPRGFDASINFRQKVSTTGMLKVFSSMSIGDLALFSDNLDDLSAKDHLGLNSDNYYLNINYRDIIGEDWTIFGGVSYSFDKDKINLNNDKINQTEKLGQAKLTFTKGITENSFLTFGGEIHNTIYEDAFNQFDMNLNEVYTAAYVEADIFFTNDLAGRIGVRSEHSNVLNKLNAAPRVSFAYRLGTFDQLNFAYGKFYQTPTKDYLFQTKNFNYENASHYILNYQYIGNDRTFRIELYYKDYNELVKGTVFTYPYFNLPPVSLSNDGEGYAKGIDVFYRDKETFDYTDFWVSYSFLDTKRNYKNYPSMAFPTFATPHTFSVVAKRWLPSITTSVGVTYTFATGRPYFNPNNPEFLGDKAKSYNNLSLNVSYLTNVFGNFTVIFFSVDNLPGFSNIFGYRYSSDGTIKMPVVPPALRTAFIGMFINLGKSNPY